MRLKGLLIYACFFAGSLAAQNTSILYEVNMSYQIQTGNFDLQVDSVDIAGTSNGWGADLSPLADLDGDSIYSLQLSVVSESR